MCLAKYDYVFQKDLDQMWTKHDADGNGYLDKEEALPFLDEVAQIIDQSRAKNHDRSQFDTVFEKFDEDKNGFLSKAEMATLIKIIFRKK